MQYEVATSASILPWGVEFYIIFVSLVVQYEITTFVSILPCGVRILECWDRLLEASAPEALCSAAALLYPQV